MEQLSIFDLGIENKSTKQTSKKIIRAKDLKVIQIESYVYTLDKETISKLFISANGGGTIHKIKIEYLERI
jgi:hypothetical protein